MHPDSSRYRFTVLFRSVSAMLLVASTSQVGLGQSVWITGQTGNWSTGNWQNGVPGPSDAAEIDSSTLLPSNVTLTTSESIASLEILANNSIVTQLKDTLRITEDGHLDISGNADIFGRLELDSTGEAIDASLVTLHPGGQLEIDGSNQFSDDTTLFQLGGQLIGNGFSHTLAGFSFSSGSISGLGQLTLTGTSTTALSIGSGSFSGLSFQLTGDSNGGISFNNVSLTSTSINMGSVMRRLDIAAGNTTYEGSLTGTGGIRKTGSGIVSFQSPANYFGPTTIDAGSLELDGSSSSIQFSSNFTISDGASLSLQGGTISTNSIVSNGSLDFSSGNLTLFGPGSDFGSQHVVIGSNFGTSYLRLTANADARFSQLELFDNDTTVDIEGAELTADTITNTNGGVINFDGGTITTGRFFHSGGTFNYNSGALNLTNSGLTVSNSGLLGNSVVVDAEKPLSVSGTTKVEAGGTLTIDNGTLTTGKLNNDGDVVFNSGSFTILDGRMVLDDTLLESDGVNIINSWGEEPKGLIKAPLTVDGEDRVYIGRRLFVGPEGTGHLIINNGGQVESANGYIAAAEEDCFNCIGFSSNSNGIVSVSGAGSLWTIGNEIRIGQNGTSTISITDGGSIQSGRVNERQSPAIIGVEPFDFTFEETGSVQITIDGVAGNGTPSTWNHNGYLLIGSTEGFSSVNNDVQIDITSGGVLSATGSGPGFSGISMERQGSGLTQVNVTGVGSTLSTTARLEVGGFESGDVELNVNSGGLLMSRGGRIQGASVTIEGENTVWTNDGNLSITTGSTFVVRDNATVEVSGATTTKQITLENAIFRTGSLGDDGNFNWISGRLVITSEQGLPLDDSFTVFRIRPQQTLEVLNEVVTGENGLLVIEGGTVDAGSIDNPQQVVFRSGTLNLHGELRVPVDQRFDIVDTFNAANTTVTENDGQIVAVGADLTFPADGVSNNVGLINRGRMILADTIVNGDIRTTAGSSIDVASNVVFNGLISGVGDFTGGGTTSFTGGIAPGASPAELTFGGNVLLTATNRLEIELGGLVPGTEFDRLVIDGSIDLDGTLNVSLISNFAPTLGDSFEIISASALQGTIAAENLPNLTGDLAWKLDYTTTALVLEVILPGDFNSDGTVDLADYNVWRNNLGAPEGTLPNDSIGGAVGTAQYEQWKANFGASAAAPISTDNAVPEPSTMALTVLLLAAISAKSVRRTNR